MKNDEYSLKDTFDFINKLNKYQLKDGEVMISLGLVVSLFTNVPIDETLQISKERFFKDPNDFANLFMNDFEKKHMPHLISLGVKWWQRYVDDCFIIKHGMRKANPGLFK